MSLRDEMPKVEPGYLYHWARASRLDDIAEHGLKTRKCLYTIASLHFAHGDDGLAMWRDYASRSGKVAVALLRVKAEHVHDPQRDEMNFETVTYKGVSSEHIERWDWATRSWACLNIERNPMADVEIGLRI